MKRIFGAKWTQIYSVSQSVNLMAGNIDCQIFQLRFLTEL